MPEQNMPGKCLVTALFFLAPFMTALPAEETSLPCALPDKTTALKTAAKIIQADLEALDQAVAAAALNLAQTDLTNSAARAILASLCAGHTGVLFDVCAVNPRGVIAAVEPVDFQQAEGRDIADQQHVQQLLAKRKPVMSRALRAVEGMNAVIIAHPVFDANNTFLGSINAVCSPSGLIERRAPELIANTSFELWAMQPDGLILYDRDSDEIGRELFSHPAYQPFTELLQLALRMTKEPEGSGAYVFFKDATSDAVQKNAAWTTLSLHNTPWRLIMTHIDQAALETAKAKRDSSSLLKPCTENDLRRLANDLVLLRAINADDKAAALRRFEQVAAKRSNIYSLTWINSKGINCFGYPAAHSLENVDLRQATDDSSKKCVEALDSLREASFESELIEGGRASFFMVPVRQGQEHKGALLWIHKHKPQEEQK